MGSLSSAGDSGGSSPRLSHLQSRRSAPLDGILGDILETEDVNEVPSLAVPSVQPGVPPGAPCPPSSER